MTLVQRGGGHVRVILDRPARRNSIDDELLGELSAALTAAEAAPDCRVFVISALGEDFCAGMDLSASHEDHAGEDELPYWTLLRRLASSSLVTVSLVDGAATAGGVGLAAACDVVLAGARATFRLTEALFGLVPAMALPFVARRTGEQQAFTATLLATEFDAAEAVRIGLADRSGDSAEQLLRPLLVSLRRIDRGTVSALKSYRSSVFGWPEDLGAVAAGAFLDRLAAPGVRERMSGLKNALVAS
ncbi:enoyl-CoA hydratase-related protein [Lentzea flava]|uniref:Enoyl-CoA hydratase n=1 Tax=Lentzea flava TaxID=103732 RepID=A0ABQ2UIP8_9PSEU|nr:enoyl-CoA hydratase-related protein [Lentzea flava]MCP2198999.1 polyketide biosynthesis enoyl-CoA hydratase PksH [Lentzea flava]GGU32373.1 enoyl-CoA hydratase [Lentzea flava]